MGTVDPDGALGNSQLLAAVAGSGGHDSQAEALDLLREQSLVIQAAAAVPVALQEHGAAQMVHRV